MEFQLDWLTVAQVVVAVFGLVGQVYISRLNAFGFICWTVSNTAAIVINLHVGTYVMAAMFTAYLGLSLYGLWSWRQRGRVCRVAV